MVQMAQTTHTSPHANLQVTDQSGQAACFNCVIETYQTQAYNLARRMLSDWSLAEDAVQESFVSAYRAFNRFRGENLTAWVLQEQAEYISNSLGGAELPLSKDN